MIEAPRNWEERADAGDGNFAIACALLCVANEIRRLGYADAATPMGAIEAFALHIGEHIDSLSSNVGEIADALTGVHVVEIAEK